ncbi:MAG: CoA transferase subunit A [Deltaproteobacteria bacterium]|nr:CoA transferase subunit A [Deltaproteobacteria bacterium]
MIEHESGNAELLLNPDMDVHRAWMRDHKSMKLTDKVMGEAEAVRTFIKEGDFLATELYGSVRAPMGICREIVRQGYKALRFAGQGVMETELLIAGRCVTATELTYQGWEVYGISNVLRRAAEGGHLAISEWSNAALAWRLKAAAMGISFIPTRSMLGTDTFRYSGAKTITCPFTGQRYAALPATMVDVGIIHAHRADRFGNVQVDGITGFAWELARASRRLIVSVEELITTDEIRRQPDRTLIPWYLTDAIVHQPFGSWPGEMCYVHDRDGEHLKAYLAATETAEGTKAYHDEWVTGVPCHEALLEKIGPARLAELRSRALGR